MVKIVENEINELDEELAAARVAFAETILAADNCDDLLLSLNHLFLAEVNKTMSTYKSGKKSAAKREKHTADEIFTIMMCAAYRSQEKRNR